jgi:hypothetical protein
MKPSDDDRLDSLLKAWTAPPSPSSLERSMRSAYRRRARFVVLRWLLFGSLRVPVPVTALILAAMLVLSVQLWRGPKTAVVRQPAVANAASAGYQFVSVLTPRIERRNHARE